jgi:hypothetical protein
MIEIYWLLMDNKKLNSTENGWVAEKQEIISNHKIIRRLVFTITLLYMIVYTSVSLVMYNDLI